MRNSLLFKLHLLCIIFSFISLIAVAQSEAKLEINPSNLDMGERPIGAWQEPAYLHFFNDGPGDIIITTSELAQANNFFSANLLDLPLTMPEGTSINLAISFFGEGIPEDIYSATYSASWNTGKGVTSAEITATAYTAVIGDIFENPYTISLPYTETDISTAFPIRANYNIPNTPNTNDVVYKFTLSQSEEVDITVSNASADAKIAIYAEDFNGEEGPKATNALFSANNQIVNAPLFIGTYYLIISATQANTDLLFDLNIESSEMPISEKAFNPSPADGEMDVINPVLLAWEFGQYTYEYKLSFGTTYPVSEVLVDWTSDLATSYELGYIDPSMQYFWEVDVRNSNGTIDGDNWSFTTTVTPPAGLTATVDEVDPMVQWNVDLAWTSSDKALLGYNIYRDEIIIGTTSNGISTYTDEDVAYNMDPCYQYTVEAVFDEGVAMSEVVTACITGVGFVNGTVTALITGEPISGGAEVMLLGASGYFTFVTDMYGHYSGEVYEGVYSYVVMAEGYIEGIRDDVNVAYNTTQTEDFILGEYPVVADTVWAIPLNEDQVFIEWDTSSYASNYTNYIQGYNIYRQLYDQGSTLEFLGNTTELSFTDENWGEAEMGIYNWGVEVIYVNQTSQMVFSNHLDKDMVCTVNIEVTTNTADSPEDTEILFFNTSEPYLELFYDFTLDETGFASIENFRKGIYDITVFHPDYDPLIFQDVIIDADTNFIWLLDETLYTPVNLYVTPTGIATWDQGNYIYFSGLFEDFNTQEAFDNWEIIIGGNTADTWQWTTEYNGSSLNGTAFAFVNSHGAGNGSSMDELLISPTINASMVEELFLEWDQNYQNLSGQDHFTVEVFDGSNWQNVYEQNTDDEPWPAVTHQSINVSNYANEDFKVRFHYIAPGWNWNLAIDNISIHSPTSKNVDDKMFQLYKVWHDGVFAADTDTGFLDYANPDYLFTLIEDETYIAEVTALYTTGYSPLAEYEWIYIPSSSFAGPDEMDAELIEGTNDMLVTWAKIENGKRVVVKKEEGLQKKILLSPLNKDNENFEILGTNLYCDDELLAFIPTPDTFYLVEDMDPNGIYNYCLATVYTEDDGLHSWTSPTNILCIQIIGCLICDPPTNLTVDDIIGDPCIAVLKWDKVAADLDNSQRNINSKTNEFLGYNIYKDGIQINEELVLDTNYQDPHICNAPICYEVTAVYTDCESDPSNEACLPVMPATINDKNRFNIYPNPAKDFLKIESSYPILYLAISNYLGQKLFIGDSYNTKEISLNISDYPSGLYFLEIETTIGLKKVKLLIR